MFFQDAQNQITSISIANILTPIIVGIVMSAVTYGFTRRKSEGETLKIYIGIISDLKIQLDSWIKDVKSLRGEVTMLEDANRELGLTIGASEDAENERLKAVQKVFNQTIDTMQRLIDEESKHNVIQTVRMRTVEILESLYKIRDLLKKRPPKEGKESSDSEGREKHG